MPEVAGNNSLSLSPEDRALEARITRTMVVAIGLAAAVSAVIAPWRVMTGILLGGGLSIFNYRWTRSSVAAIIQGSAQGVQVSPRASRYLLRYLVITVVCVAAYQLNLVSLPATIGGLCSFVVALFVEAMRQFYFAVINREETD